MGEKYTLVSFGEGSYSYTCAKMFAERLGNSEISSEASIEGIASRVNGNSLGVIAYYNTHDKQLRHDCLDIIIDESLRIIASERVLVRLAIAKHPSDNAPNTVYSLPRVIRHVSHHLERLFPNATFSRVESTAESIKRVQETGKGVAIADYEKMNSLGFDMLVRNASESYTDFLLVCQGDKEALHAEEYLSMLAIQPRLWTSDYRKTKKWIIDKISDCGLTITKCHAPPEPPQDTLPMLYFELNAHEKNSKCFDLVAALSKNVPEGCTLERIQFIGSYCNPTPGRVGSSAMLPAVKDKLPPENLLT
jgi:prephenate dehydratase